MSIYFGSLEIKFLIRLTQQDFSCAQQSQEVFRFMRQICCLWVCECDLESK